MIMKQVILNVPDNKYPFFMELVKSLGFVKVPEETKLTKKQHEFVDGTISSLEQVEQHLKGEIILKTADQLFNELSYLHHRFFRQGTEKAFRKIPV
jgi:hypothetical protein